MKPLLQYSAALAAVLGSIAAQAQDVPIKFGKPEPADFTAAAFAADSAAAAVILCDYGNARMEMGADGHLQAITDRTTRIKILKKAGYSWATVEIPLVTGAQKLVGLRGFTYTLANGTTEKTKLEDDGKFTDDVDTRIHIRKFTMPNVHEGSVIEFTYSIVSGVSMGLPNWQFQYAIPVRWSEYRVNYPDYFNYKTVMRGYLPLSVREQSLGSTIMGARATRTILYRWAMRNVPALREEPYITTMRDYAARMDLELTSFYVPGFGGKDFTGTWEKIDATLLQDDSFGLQLDRGGFLKDNVAKLGLGPATTVEARAAAIHSLVRDAVKYNEYETIYTSNTLRKTFELHRGNAADINILLIAALRSAGIDANPVLLSTRKHGYVAMEFPLSSRFNYVVAHVGLADGKELLLDATEPLLPCGMLPERCLNQVGRLVMPDGKASRWLDLTPSQRRVHYQQVQLALTPEGALSGKVHEEYSGYAGATARTELEKLGETKYRTQFAGKHTAWTVPKFTVSERTNLLKPLVLDYEFAQPAEEAAAGALYLNPFTEFASEQNPFRHENRTFPVDFGALQEETMLLTLNLPAGYELAEMPKPTVVDLPDNGGRFFYTIAASEGTVSITSRLSLRKPVYAASDYQYLRELYRLMLAKQSEKFVLKKKA
ncbi:DUF3857 domain-containing protein [Hymenobacter negativus]|uniref:DUF3857 domain-containing protein n=1 Tax=Hymenobacter negativus TaxID=2795026 RepID=A0ABS3QEE5_9BACT|nr:DUF3857 domain-containing protein [Hymenobacter negativus]MBO2009617.1 DUF3857 domain-containing protein [Hymenobacter negativus]